MDFLSTKDGLARMRTFVRRFKRKGGDAGKPGDIDKLIEELHQILDGEADEDLLRALLEGHDEGDDEDIWTEFKGTIERIDYDKIMDFMLTLNKIGWVPEKPFI